MNRHTSSLSSLQGDETSPSGTDPSLLKAVIYIRLSSYRGESDPTTSPERQRQSCEAYAAAKGWDVIEVIEDLNVSGTEKGLRLDRPGLKQVRDLFDQVDIVLFAKLDRLARNVSDFTKFAEEAAAHDVALVSVAESLDLTSPSGRFVATILAAFAEMEGATIAARTRAGTYAAAKLGRWVTGAPPYGYEVVAHPDGAGKTLAIVPEEAAHIRAAMEHVVAGSSTYSAAKLLTERGAKPRRTERWRTQSVRSMLKNANIRGYMRYGGDLLRGPDGLPLQTHNPIITKAEALAIDTAIPDERVEPFHRVRAARLLSGLLVCETCGGNLTLQVSRGQTLYRCVAVNRSCTKAVSIVAETVEEYITGEFLDKLGWMPIIETVTVDVGAVELAEVETAIATTTDELRDPQADVQMLVERLTKLRERREVLVRRPRTETATVATGETFAEAWEARELVGRQDLLKAAIEQIVVYRANHRRLPVAERVEIHWRD